MLHDVAAGMSYLHGRNHVHGDLRSPNLFVGADGKVGGCVALVHTATAAPSTTEHQPSPAQMYSIGGTWFVPVLDQYFKSHKACVSAECSSMETFQFTHHSFILYIRVALQVKIGDFGFTKRLACNAPSLRVSRVTHPRWVAPEVRSSGRDPNIAKSCLPTQEHGAGMWSVECTAADVFGDVAASLLVAVDEII